MLRYSSGKLEQGHRTRYVLPIRHMVTSLIILCLITAVWPSSVVAGAALTDKTPPFYTQVAGGEFYTVALRNDGSVWEWGRNMTGSLALQKTGTYINTSAPVRVANLSDIISIRITQGSAQNLAVKSDGTVWQWGADDCSKYKDRCNYSILPEQVKGVADTIAVDATDKVGYAVHKDGSVWQWSRLANQADTADGSPSTQVKGLNNVTQVMIGEKKLYAVKQDGTVWSLSLKEKQQATPVKIKGLANIKQIYVYNELLALDKKGKLWHLKENGKVTSIYPTLKLKEVKFRASSMLLLTESGDVYSYGDPMVKNGKVSGLPKIQTIGTGTYHSLAVSTDGKMWGWGGNKYLELGAPSKSPDGMVYHPIQALDDIDIYLNGSVIALGYPAIKTDASVQIPLASLARVMGAQLTYTLGSNGYPETYTLTFKDKTVVFHANQTTIQANDQGKELPEMMSAVGGAVTIPYQLLEMGLNVKVTWDPVRRRIDIQSS